MDNKMSLLVEIHESLEEFSKISEAFSNPEKAIIWDDFNLTEDEVSELKSIQFSNKSISGIEKIIRDKMLLSFHHFFAVMDGVGDPKLRNDDTVWLGVRLVNKSVNDEIGYEEFLHDMLFDAYWNWLEMKSVK